MRIVLVLVLLPQVAAWGPYAHQYWCGLSDEIIYSEFGNATDSFKVGCWAPDVFKHFNSSFYMHSWHFADFLANFARDRAESNRETAFAFGFGAHLLADQLGHRKGGPLSEEQETVGAPDPGHLMYDRYLNTNKEGKLVWRPFYFFTDDLHPILIDSTTAYAREYPEKLISPKTLETEGRPLNATSTADAISNGVARWNTFRRHVIADVAWKKQLYGNPCDVGSEEEFNKNFDRLKEWTQNVQGWWLETLIAAEPAKTAQWSSQTQINHLYRDHGGTFCLPHRGVTAWEVASLSSGLLFITTLFVFLMYQDHVRHLSRMSRKNLKMIK